MNEFLEKGFFGHTFPKKWILGKYEIEFLEILSKQIKSRFPENNGLLVNLTWLDQEFLDPPVAKILREHCKHNNIENLFLFSSVDPVSQSQLDICSSLVDHNNIFMIGNFAGPLTWNIFAIMLAKEFTKHGPDDIILREPNYLFLSYNRKPRRHRVKLVNRIIEEGLDKYGIITLGKNDSMYDQEESHPFLSLGEDVESYRDQGHWYTADEEIYGLPHDLGLGRLDLWQNHFLTISGNTTDGTETVEHFFAPQIIWKPIIGLRPFVINGDPKLYEYLRSRGFETFEKDLGLKIYNNWEDNIGSIIELLKDLSKLKPSSLKSMYDSLLPKLLHNRNRFFEFAAEEELRIHKIIEEIQ